MRLVPPGRRGRRGFTIVETAIVLALVAVAAAVAVPRYRQSLARYRADAAAARIASDVDFARQLAVSRSGVQSIVFYPAAAGNHYELPAAEGLDNPSATYSVDLADSRYRATLTSANLGGDAELRFDRFGSPDSGGTIVVECAGQQRTLTVDAATGGVTISKTTLTALSVSAVSAE